MRQGKGNSGSVVSDHHLVVCFISLLSTKDSPAASKHSGWHNFTTFSYYMKSAKSPNFQLNDHQSVLRKWWRNPYFEEIPTHLGREQLLKELLATAHTELLLQKKLFKHCGSSKSPDRVSGHCDAPSRHCINLQPLAHQLLVNSVRTDLGSWGHREQYQTHEMLSIIAVLLSTLPTYWFPFHKL